MTVIIPTLASTERASSLLRAIESIREQGGLCDIVAVVNGDRRDANAVVALRAMDDIHILDIPEAGHAKARLAGVKAIATPYFSMLDDDDILMPGAVRRRVDYMEAHPDADVLVTPGLRQGADGRVWRVPQILERNVLASALKDNWLVSCGGVFRRSRISADYFTNMPRYLEWTYLALQLARERNVHFMLDDPAPHFRVVETALSESRSLDCALGSLPVFLQMQELPLPNEIKRLVSSKLAAALHFASSRCLERRQFYDAWKYHLASMCRSTGWKYLPFTRHLLSDALFSNRIKVSDDTWR